MYLRELQPRWIGEYGAPDHAKQGVSFQCPHCAGTETLRLAVFFDVPICGLPAVSLTKVHAEQVDDGEQPGHLADHHIGSILWHREGTTFDDMTLSPSIDASAFGHWHGYITSGQIR